MHIIYINIQYITYQIIKYYIANEIKHFTLDLSRPNHAFRIIERPRWEQIEDE